MDKEVLFVETGARYQPGFLSRCTSAIKASAMISWTQYDKYNKLNASGGEEKRGTAERQPEPLFHEGCDRKVTPGFLPCSFPRAVIAPRSHFLPRFGHMLYLAAGRGSS